MNNEEGLGYDFSIKVQPVILMLSNDKPSSIGINELLESESNAALEDNYGVKFASKQSYYQLFADADISWKNQKRNPKAEPELVEKKNNTSTIG